MASINLSKEEKLLVKSLARHSSHPLSQAIYLYLDGENLLEVEKFEEIPSLGISGIINGKLVKTGSEEYATGRDSGGKTYTTSVFVTIDGIFKGHFEISNKYRPGMDEVVSLLKHNYNLHLLSGDNDSEKENLLPVFGDAESLHFRQTPKDKLQYILELKSSGMKILMVGDGLNDAGALKESDVGITIADNVYHFSPACDAILDSSRFREIPKFIRFSKTAYRIVIAGFCLSFIYNVVGISFGASGQLTPLISAILMPLSSVSVVAFATFTTYMFARRAGITSFS
jgi:Cu+-exporting ATPase